MPIIETSSSTKDNGKEFTVIKDQGMVAAFEVLRELENYLVLSSALPPNPEKYIPLAEPSDLKNYAEYVERRAPYIRNETEAQLPGIIRHLYRQIVDGLRGPDWMLSPIDPCFTEPRNAILLELTKIGLTQAAWFYVVDNLPTDSIQLRSSLLVMMPEKMKNDWKDETPVKLKRIMELVFRLKFLMRLSRSGVQERERLLDDLDIPQASTTEESTVSQATPFELALKFTEMNSIGKGSSLPSSSKSTIRSTVPTTPVNPAATRHTQFPDYSAPFNSSSSNAKLITSTSPSRVECRQLFGHGYPIQSADSTRQPEIAFEQTNLPAQSVSSGSAIVPLPETQEEEELPEPSSSTSKTRQPKASRAKKEKAPEAPTRRSGRSTAKK